MKVFISHSLDDTPYARELSAALRRRGVDVLDSSSIKIGESLPTELGKMMDGADAFVMLTSRSSSESLSLDHEVAAAAARAWQGRGIRMVPVMLDQQAEIPPLLSRYQFVRPSDARDPDHVAELVRNSLETAVSPPDLDRERDIVDANLASLHAEIEQTERATARDRRLLTRVLGLLGLVTGVNAAAFVADLWYGGPSRSGLALVVIAGVSGAISVILGIIAVSAHLKLKRRSSDDD